MAENSIIMGMVAAFIGIAIILGVGTQILGNATFECEDLDGFNSTNPEASDSWAGTCIEANDNSQSAYTLLLVTLIVVAAVAILLVVRML